MVGHETRTERYVPRRVGEITAGLANHPWTGVDESAEFRAFAQLVGALFHFESYATEQSVLDLWDRIDDDADAAHQIRDELVGLLTAANYVEITPAELQDAIERESLIKLRLNVDLEDYDELVIYRRGSTGRDEAVKRWRYGRERTLAVTVEESVVLMTRVKPQAWFDNQGIDPNARNLIPGQVSLKQFRDVPRADINMLLPSTQVRLRRVDSVMVGLPAVASGVAVLATKLLPTLGLLFVLIGAWLGLRDDEPDLNQASLVVLFGGLLTLGGFFVRQWSKLKNRRMQYLKTLSETLYFRTSADGPGVLHTLLSAAEHQEVIEVLLGYRFLLEHPDGCTMGELDAAIETWLASTCQREINFEIDDAVAKLDELDLIRRDGSCLFATPTSEALHLLDSRWDAIFDHRRHEPNHPGPA